jgi:hypothetical protein
MAKIKVPYTRRSSFSDKKLYIYYLEWLKNCCNAVDGTFYDAIKNNSLVPGNVESTKRTIFSGGEGFNKKAASSRKQGSQRSGER